jgi:hypothetical protein
MRAKHIKRKKRIVSHWHWFENGYYPHDGMYSKNKIHCSCPLCKEKARHNGKHLLTERELISIMKMNEEKNCSHNVASGEWEYTD